MARPLLSLFAFALTTGIVSAQIPEPGQPASASHELPTSVPQIVLPAPPATALRAEDDARGNWPYRYGAQIPVELDAQTAGRWDVIASTGELVWRIEIASPGAYSLGVLLSAFDLPAEGRLFLYDPDRTNVLGAYTERNEKPNGALAIQPLAGDRLVLEYVQPGNVTAIPELTIGEVIHDYRDVIADITGGIAFSSACLVDINCPAGASHQDVKRAVVWMFGGGGGCSGSILNNTAEDGTPYLYTAEHCGNQTNAIFVFDYELTGCGSGSSSQSKTVSGATLLAASTVFDSQLYLMSSPPPDSYDPFYLGWTRTNMVTAPEVGISHPAGLPKKIQVANDPPFQTSTQRNVVFQVGIVQGGSSGSPLMDSEERVVGTLTSATNPCGSNLCQYGRFDRFYATADLETWLDPEGWELEAIDGYDPVAPYTLATNGSGVNPEIYASTSTPTLGSTWSAAVDVSGQPGTTSTLLFGYAKPAEGPLSALGELLVDPASTLLFSSSAAAGGGTSTYDFALPADAGLAGAVAYTQAFLLGGGVTATNAVKVIVNF